MAVLKSKASVLVAVIAMATVIVSSHAALPTKTQCYQVTYRCTTAPADHARCQNVCQFAHSHLELAFCENEHRCCCRYILPQYDHHNNDGPGDIPGDHRGDGGRRHYGVPVGGNHGGHGGHGGALA